jgi:uncharacterized delta-60 repeat protein
LRSRPSIRPHLEAFEDRCLPSTAQLDPSFGSGGIVHDSAITANGVMVTPQFQAIQPNGGIIVAAATKVARLTAGGAVDPSFASGGIFSLSSGQSVPPSNFQVSALAVDSQGRILLGGDAGVLRLTATGTIDTTFGQGGFAPSPLNGGLILASLAVGPGDQVLLDAPDTTQSQAVVDVVRYTSAGALDSSFGSGGVAAVNYGASSSNAGGALLIALPNGGVLLGGTNMYTGLGFALTVTRLTSAGAFDSSFNGLGFIALPTFSQGGLIAAEPDGSVIVAGGVPPAPAAGATQVGLTHLLTNGTIDSTFGTNGSLLLQNPPLPAPVVGGGFSPTVQGLSITADNRIVVLTEIDAVNPRIGGQPFEAFLTRLNINGQTDASFAPDGFAITDTAFASHLVVQPDDNLLVIASNPSMAPFGATQVERYLGGSGSNNSNLLFVNGALMALFHRAFNSSNPFDAGLLNGLNTGAFKPIDVTALMELSVEGQTVNTNDLFQKLLLRTPAANELAFYQAFLAQGVSEQQLEGIILSGDEFFNVIADGTDGGWVNSVFSVILGRQAGAGDQAFFTSQLLGLQQFFGFTAAGARQVVATEIVLSPEAAVVQAGILFTNLLARQADPAGLSYVSSLLVGQPPTVGDFAPTTPVMPLQNVMAILVASPEFIARS